MSGAFVERWLRGPELTDWRTLNARLAELERVLSRIHERAENGPLPGSYVSVPLIVGNVQLGSGTFPYAAAQLLEASMRPIHLSLFVGDNDPKGTINSFQVYAGGSAVLTNAIQLTVGTNLSTLRKSRSDFAIDSIPAGALVRLEIVVSAAVGAYARNIHGRLVCKHVGRVEPV